MSLPKQLRDKKMGVLSANGQPKQRWDIGLRGCLTTKLEQREVYGAARAFEYATWSHAGHRMVGNSIKLDFDACLTRWLDSTTWLAANWLVSSNRGRCFWTNPGAMWRWRAIKLLPYGSQRREERVPCWRQKFPLTLNSCSGFAQQFDTWLGSMLPDMDRGAGSKVPLVWHPCALHTQSSSTGTFKFVTCVNKSVRAGVLKGTHIRDCTQNQTHMPKAQLFIYNQIPRIMPVFVELLDCSSEYTSKLEACILKGLVDVLRCKPLSGPRLRHRTNQGNRHTTHLHPAGMLEQKPLQSQHPSWDQSTSYQTSFHPVSWASSVQGCQTNWNVWAGTAVHVKRYTSTPLSRLCPHHHHSQSQDRAGPSTW